MTLTGRSPRPEVAADGGMGSLSQTVAVRHGRLFCQLEGRVDADGALNDQCDSRVVESALFLVLIRKQTGTRRPLSSVNRSPAISGALALGPDGSRCSPARRWAWAVRPTVC
jgi:hypothetical protein